MVGGGGFGNGRRGEGYSGWNLFIWGVFFRMRVKGKGKKKGGEDG